MLFHFQSGKEECWSIGGFHWQNELEICHSWVDVTVNRVSEVFISRPPAWCLPCHSFICLNGFCFCSDTLYMSGCQCVFMVNGCAISKCLQTFGDFNESDLNINGLWIIPYEVLMQWILLLQVCTWCKCLLFNISRLKLLEWECKLAYSSQESIHHTIQQDMNSLQPFDLSPVCLKRWWKMQYSKEIQEHMLTPHCLLTCCCLFSLKFHLI